MLVIKTFSDWVELNFLIRFGCLLQDRPREKPVKSSPIAEEEFKFILTGVGDINPPQVGGGV